MSNSSNDVEPVACEPKSSSAGSVLAILFVVSGLAVAFAAGWPLTAYLGSSHRNPYVGGEFGGPTTWHIVQPMPVPASLEHATHDSTDLFIKPHPWTLSEVQLQKRIGSVEKGRSYTLALTVECKDPLTIRLRTLDQQNPQTALGLDEEIPVPAEKEFLVTRTFTATATTLTAVANIIVHPDPHGRRLSVSNMTLTLAP
jgi:hypothetical protein